jgi:hypothetical protein
MHTSDFQFAPQSASKHYYPDKVPLPDCGPNMAEFRPIEAQSCRTASHRNDHNLLLTTATVPARNELPTSSAISVFRPIILAHRKHPSTSSKMRRDIDATTGTTILGSMARCTFCDSGV